MDVPPTYRIYIDKSGVSEVVGETSETQKVITFSEEGSYVLGVSALRTVEDGYVLESSISWSNDINIVEGGVTFGVRHYIPFEKPTGLRK
jgi:hypothetical protein